MDWLIDPGLWASLLTLTALEIVLGIDNLVFIAILAGRLPTEQQNRARQIGLALALTTRLGLLASIAWIISLTQPLFELFGHAVSWRDIVLIAGGFSSSIRVRGRFITPWKATSGRKRKIRRINGQALPACSRKSCYSMSCFRWIA
jgi:predicted tellurium resistance membrane protein TerC